ncbi:hypothetical protein [Lentibacillus salicampi]|uniref:Uncharacterized protein n=1 Tax=Lentibacillus salicampi TaxID=175306 RepID=A0A4Y9A7E4_9BACI|nr:hypothetical protein [Lentibacillus salicampi]TFJ91669.1 hypothetical protein E4U82_16475 [Lentibacillus salicampi]
MYEPTLAVTNKENFRPGRKFSTITEAASPRGFSHHASPTCSLNFVNTCPITSATACHPKKQPMYLTICPAISAQDHNSNTFNFVLYPYPRNSKSFLAKAYKAFREVFIEMPTVSAALIAVVKGLKTYRFILVSPILSDIAPALVQQVAQQIPVCQ